MPCLPALERGTQTVFGEGVARASVVFAAFVDDLKLVASVL